MPPVLSKETGDEPQKKKQKTLPAEADRAEKHLAPNQPGRVQLNRITWHPQNRGGQGILPLHVHNVARDTYMHERAREPAIRPSETGRGAGERQDIVAIR